MRVERRTLVRNLAIIFAFVAAIAVLLWYAGSRLSTLTSEFQAAERRVDSMQERLAEYSREVDHAIERARAARREADDAQRTATEATAAQAEAEHRVDAATSALETAEAERQQARAETLQAREELESIQARREEELNRMQEALNRIAPTKRTPSGMVMTLGENAFRFDFDKSTLRPENREVLSRIAGVLLASEGYRLFIDGHTDDIGTDDYNKTLSEKRAESVRNYLVGAGIPSDAVSMQGFGKEQPLSSRKTPEARAQNRRVEIGIVDTIVRYEHRSQN
ncbi:MAG: OmpA family protein [Bryobacteraceae bacterium]|nr:OmpA family protein [Bryobacteraceae bacterium]